jgi:hypothetical protein
MAISAEEREALHTAWNGHCDALRQVAGEAIDGALGDPADGQELAELLRSIARIAAMSLQHRLDFNNPDFPQFLRQMDDRFRYGDPDNNIGYFLATLRGDATYRLRGNNGGEGRSINIGRLWHGDIATDDHGDFEVIVSAEAHPGNWTPIGADLQGDETIPEQYPTAGNGLTVRRYDWDWDRDLPPGWLTIERIDPDAPDYPPPLSPAGLAGQITNATSLFLAAARWWNRRAANVRADNPANLITPPSTEPPGVRDFEPPMTGGKPWLYYGIICLDLAEDEAILIETDLPDGPYWSFTLYNMWWEAPDIMNRQTSLNDRQSHIDSDGRARFVISARDPGVPNWLDTGGMRRGFLHYRWFRPDQAVPTPTSRLMKIAEVRNALPADHPEVDAEARRATLSKRRAQLAKRFQR